MCIGYHSKKHNYIYNIQMRTNYMFRLFLVRPSSGWNTKIVRGTTLQYSMIDSVSVSGGDEISFTKMGVCGN
jgi:hypothetical protein